MSGTGFPALDRILACKAEDTHRDVLDENGACAVCGEYGDGPTNSWACGSCGETVYRFRGEGDVSCDCGAQYNAGGQRLRDDWADNAAWYSDDLDDMTGYELQMLRYEGGY